MLCKAQSISVPQFPPTTHSRLCPWGWVCPFLRLAGGTSILTTLRGHGRPLSHPCGDHHKHLGPRLGGTQRSPASPALLAVLEPVATCRLRPPILVPAAEKPPKTFYPPPRAPQAPTVKGSLHEGSLKPAVKGFSLRRVSQAGSRFTSRLLHKHPRQKRSHHDHKDIEALVGDQTPSQSAFKDHGGSAKSLGFLSQQASSSPPSF